MKLWESRDLRKCGCFCRRGHGCSIGGGGAIFGCLIHELTKIGFLQ